MSPSPAQANRFFVSPQYSIYYRRQKKFEPHHEVPSEYRVVFLLEGSLTLNSPHSSRPLLKEQALLLNPPEASDLTGKAVETLWLSLSPAFVADYAVRMHLSGSGAMVMFVESLIAADERLLNFARSLAAELNENKPGSEIVIAALIEQILVHLLRNYANMRRSPDLELSRAGLVDRRIRRSVELMHAQLASELSLKEIAAASYLSTFHFARVFKKLTGQTPYGYLASIRTSRAQALLANSDLSISEVGALVGYSTPSHFTKAFRQSTGLTPRAFRNALVSG